MTGHKPQLSGASQDEIQLLTAGEDSGFAKMISKNSDSVTIQLNGTNETYNIMKVFDFTSERKMMSVVFKR